LAADGGEWSASHFDHFDTDIHRIGGWVGARASVDVSEKRNISYPYQDSNPGSSSLYSTLSVCLTVRKESKLKVFSHTDVF
jgi:hypothetical protein